MHNITTDHIKAASSDVSVADLQAKIKRMEEHVQAQEQMMAMTTNYMADIQQKLEASNAALTQKNRLIDQSMRYGRKLQEANMPAQETFSNCFADGFYHLKQKDIIGGDLLILIETEGLVYVAAMDCTGHSIPGAMLSMMAHSHLKEIILQTPRCEPGKLLETFNRLFTQSFTHQSKRMRDGLDLILCCIDKHHKAVKFAGARRPLIAIRNGVLHQYKTTRASIGDKPTMQFDTSSFTYQSGDLMYMYSDGIVDQFGGASDKKFGSQRLHNLFTTLQAKPMAEQKRLLIDAINKYQGEKKQIDDQLCIGIKLN